MRLNTSLLALSLFPLAEGAIAALREVITVAEMTYQDC